MWTDRTDEILRNDHAVMLAYVTPAHGVVLTPMGNFGGLHDREAGIVKVNSSVGVWRKLDRIARNPNVALAFHTRAHARSQAPGYVLVQGRASLSAPIEDYPSTVVEEWDRIEPWSSTPRSLKRWMRIYARRVEIRIAVERITAWPDLRCAGEATVFGEPEPPHPPSQLPPAKGTGPRVSATRAARRAKRLPHVLLGWVGSDGRPFVVPVEVEGASAAGMVLAGQVPPGARRAGLTAHWFSRGLTGQRQQIYTGWLEAEEGRITYAPHTLAAYAMPPSRTIYRIAVGAATRRRYRSASPGPAGAPRARSRRRSRPARRPARPR
jgi:Pyridoxamine 5'-phosphate oxidase